MSVDFAFVSCILIGLVAIVLTSLCFYPVCHPYWSWKTYAAAVLIYCALPVWMLLDAFNPEIYHPFQYDPIKCFMGPGCPDLPFYLLVSLTIFLWPVAFLISLFP